MDRPAESSTPQVMRRSCLREGRPFPLGATWNGLGVNFVLFSAHATKVELCLFDAAGQKEIESSFNPDKLMLGPYAKAVSTISTWQSRVGLDRDPRQWPTT